ncbi:hypothetical protein, partial [Thiohalorhabdus sp.]|uniref:hypothetical protein n=1 Tax=Thiohalorhabdus sp. TaxID=3094134 RepID=UPI002FC3DAE3
MRTVSLFKHHVKAITLVLGGLDFLTFVAAILAAAHIRVGSLEQALSEHAPAGLPGVALAALVMVGTMVATGLYQRRSGQLLPWLLPRLAIAFVI